MEADINFKSRGEIKMKNLNIFQYDEKKIKVIPVLYGQAVVSKTFVDQEHYLNLDEISSFTVGKAEENEAVFIANYKGIEIFENSVKSNKIQYDYIEIPEKTNRIFFSLKGSNDIDIVVYYFAHNEFHKVKRILTDLFKV